MLNYKKILDKVLDLNSIGICCVCDEQMEYWKLYIPSGDKNICQYMYIKYFLTASLKTITGNFGTKMDIYKNTVEMKVPLPKKWLEEQARKENKNERY